MNTSVARPAGTALAWRALELGGVRLIALARFFVLAKLLAPDDFGLLAIAAVAIELSLALTDLGLIPSLIQHRDPDDRLYDAAWTIEFIRACLVAGVLLMTAPLIAELFGDPRAAPILRGLSVATLIASLGSVRSADFVRDLRFGPVAAIELSSALTEAVVAIALAQSLGVWALVVGQIVAATVRSTLSWILAPYRPRFVRNLNDVRPLLAFGRWMLVTVIAYTAGDMVLRGVVSRRLGTIDLGLYYVAFRLAMLPKQAISDLMRPVAFPLYARLQDSPTQAAHVYRSTILAMAVVLMPSYALLATLAPSLVSEVLGARWTGSDEVIQLLSGAACISLVSECTIPLVTGLGRPHFAALVFGIRSALVVCLVWSLAGAYGVDGAAIAWLVAEATVQIVAVATTRRTIQMPFSGLRMPLMAVALVSAVTALVAWTVDTTIDGVIGVVVAVVAASVAGVGVLVVLDRTLRLGLGEGFMLVVPRFRPFRVWSSTRGIDA